MPQLVGRPYFSARAEAMGLGLRVTGTDVDGGPVPDDSTLTVTAQSLPPGASAKAGTVIALQVGRAGGAGDREPRDPGPKVHGGVGRRWRPRFSRAGSKESLSPVPAGPSSPLTEPVG